MYLRFSKFSAQSFVNEKDFMPLHKALSERRILSLRATYLAMILTVTLYRLARYIFIISLTFLIASFRHRKTIKKENLSELISERSFLFTYFCSIIITESVSFAVSVSNTSSFLIMP